MWHGHWSKVPVTWVEMPGSKFVPEFSEFYVLSTCHTYCISLYVDDGIIKQMLFAPRLNLLTGAVTMLRDMALVQVMITSLLCG